MKTDRRTPAHERVVRDLRLAHAEMEGLKEQIASQAEKIAELFAAAHTAREAHTALSAKCDRLQHENTTARAEKREADFARDDAKRQARKFEVIAHALLDALSSAVDRAPEGAHGDPLTSGASSR